MNDELQKALTDILTNVVSAKDFLISELPEYVSQLLAWHGAYSFIVFVSGLALMGIIVYANYRHIKWLKGSGYQKLSNHGMEPILMLHVFQILPIAIAVDRISIEWVQIWLAPKVWIVEYASSLVK